MNSYSEVLNINTKGNSHIVDITSNILSVLNKSNINNGLATVFSVGSTGGITTIEYEPGLIKDFPGMLDKIAPEGNYCHDRTWGDGNGHAHLRSSLIGTSFTVPVVDGEMTLGTWQQIVLVDFDTHPRTRKVVVQILGE